MTTLTLTAENKPTDLMMYDFNIVFIDVDTMVGESIFKNDDYSFTILVNSRWSFEMQRYCILHAFNHVRNNDWEMDDVNEIEARAHKG